ncbi:hypothetical protein PIB30_082075 [Stylosanthes scabra]|uniref:Uncharacterized protein n=1 Tax=Stylosanthes scabra TaxID=79078 RepID=A0ABU6TSI5_9FABA|nr:hypothetical protein [Stylosanthes scabra]
MVGRGRGELELMWLGWAPNRVGLERGSCFGSARHARKMMGGSGQWTGSVLASWVKEDESERLIEKGNLTVAEERGKVMRIHDMAQSHPTVPERSGEVVEVDEHSRMERRVRARGASDFDAVCCCAIFRRRGTRIRVISSNNTTRGEPESDEQNNGDDEEQQ